MPTITYQVQADWNRNEAFDHALSDITAYVIEANWAYGMSAAFQEVAPPARLTLLLNNQPISGIAPWSVEKSGAAFAGLVRKGVLVRVRVTYDDGATTATLFIGAITRLQVAPGHAGPRTALLTVEDPMLPLLDAEYAPPLLTNVRIDQAIAPIFDAALLAWPYPHRSWMVGVAGSGELGTGTRLYSHTLTAFDAASTTLAFCGDHLDRGVGVSAQGVIRELVAAEAGGRFFWDARAGRFAFHSRSRDLFVLDVTNFDQHDALLDPAPVYVYGDDLINHVEINFAPRVVNTTAMILWSAADLPAVIHPGETRRFAARYRDPDFPTAPLAARDGIAPVRGTDYTANTRADGLGDDVAGSLTVTARFNAESAEVLVANSGDVTAYLTRLQLRGTPITAYDRQTALAYDPVSIAAHGLHKRVLDLPALSSGEFAVQVAHALVGRFAAPIGRIAEFTALVREDDAGRVLAREVGAHIRFDDLWLVDQPNRFIIVGQRHRIIAGGAHFVTFILEPYSREAAWLLADAELSLLGVSTRLAL